METAGQTAGDEPRKPYSWYKHHAWGGLAMLSILFAIHALFGLPSEVTIPIACVLLLYVAGSLVLAYRASGELKESGEKPAPPPPPPPPPGDPPPPVDPKAQKKLAKIEKKKAKAEAKRQKKAEKEE